MGSEMDRSYSGVERSGVLSTRAKGVAIGAGCIAVGVGFETVDNLLFGLLPNIVSPAAFIAGGALVAWNIKK